MVPSRRCNGGCLRGSDASFSLTFTAMILVVGAPNCENPLKPDELIGLALGLMRVFLWTSYVGNLATLDARMSSLVEDEILGTVPLFSARQCPPICLHGPK